MNISAIEKKLLDKEIVEFKAELKKGSLLIQEAFKKYYTTNHSLVGFQGELKKELNQLLVDIVCAKEDYCAGYATNVKDNIQNLKIPQFVQDRMLDVASTKFLESINEIKEITDNLDI